MQACTHQRRSRTAQQQKEFFLQTYYDLATNATGVVLLCTITIASEFYALYFYILILKYTILTITITPLPP